MMLKELKNQNEVENDRSLIKDIKRFECSPCFDTIKQRHIGLIYSIYKAYSMILSSLNFSNDDFRKEIDFIIFESIRKFDLRRTKMKFSTWLAEQTRFFCLNKITELNKMKIVDSEPEEITRIIDECFNKNNDAVKNQEMCEYIMTILEQIKDRRVLDIFNYRYFSGIKNKMTWKEIGAKMNLTSQSCINIHNKTLKFLKHKLLSKIEQDKI